MIRELSRKEFVERRPFLAIALLLVLMVTASLPFVFEYTLHQALLHAATESARIVFINFRSYPTFLESEWIARNLARILALLALLAGAGAIAGEREAKTLPLLYTSSVSLRSVAIVKFVVIAAWLFLVAFASLGVLAAHSLLRGEPFPVAALVVSSAVAWANAIAFLGIVFAASAASRRTVVAAVCSLVVGFAGVAALGTLGLNGSALATNIVAVDGSLLYANVFIDSLVAFVITALGLLVTFVEVDRRRAA